MSAANAAYACYVTGNFPVQDEPLNSGTYSHFLSVIGHFPIPRNPNLPPDTPPDPDLYTDETLDVHVYKYVGGRGANFFQNTYRPGDVVFATGSGKLLIQDGAPRLDLFTTQLNNLTPPDAELLIESENDSTASFHFLGQCIEHRPDRVFVLRTGSYDPQVSIFLSFLILPLLITLKLGHPSNFNVICHFMNTPRFANTNSPAIGAAADVIGAYFYTDNDHLCHFRLLDLTYLPRSTTSTTTQPTSRSTTSPYKRRTMRSVSNSQESPPDAITSPRSRVQTSLLSTDVQTTGPSTSQFSPVNTSQDSEDVAQLLATSDYNDNDIPHVHKRRNKEFEDVGSDKDKDDTKMGKGKTKKPRACTFLMFLLHALLTYNTNSLIFLPSPFPFVSVFY